MKDGHSFAEVVVFGLLGLFLGLIPTITKMMTEHKHAIEPVQTFSGFQAVPSWYETVITTREYLELQDILARACVEKEK